MKAAVDTTPPARAMQHHYQCLRQPFTRTGLLKRPKSQRSSTRRTLTQIKSSIADQCSDGVQLPSRRPTTAPHKDPKAIGNNTETALREMQDEMRNPAAESGSLQPGATDTTRPPDVADHLYRQYPRQLESAGSSISAGVHLPISAAREVLEGHAMHLGEERESEQHGWRMNGCEDATMRAAVRWPPEIPTEPSSNEEAESRPQSRGIGVVSRPSSSPHLTSGPTKTALRAHRQWLATANWANAAKNAADAAEAAKNAAQETSACNSISPY